MTDAKRARVRRSLRARFAGQRQARSEAQRIAEGSALMRLAEEGLAAPAEVRVVARW